MRHWAFHVVTAAVRGRRRRAKVASCSLAESGSGVRWAGIGPHIREQHVHAQASCAAQRGRALAAALRGRASAPSFRLRRAKTSGWCRGTVARGSRARVHGIEEARAAVRVRILLGRRRVAAVALPRFTRAQLQPVGWIGEMRRPFASSTLIWKATFAGTLIFTEPSGSTGA